MKQRSIFRNRAIFPALSRFKRTSRVLPQDQWLTICMHSPHFHVDLST